MNRGYAGYYKNFFLRSSYEYAYARYLDYKKINWSYESEVYDLGHKFYKPDFFLYDENGKLTKIVEIKSRNRNIQLKARQDLELLETQNDIRCELIAYKELLELYKELPFSLTSTLNEWINSDKTTINKSLKGELNGHYNLKHNNETKKLIGQHTKKLWQTDSLARKRMLEGLRKSGVKKGYIRTPRVTKVCPNCNREFTCLSTSNKSYCSNTCAGKVAIKLATDKYVQSRIENHEAIKKFVFNWTLENKDLVKNTRFNKISSTLTPMLLEIKERFRVRDIRVITKAVLGEDLGRKELLKFMKKICDENVC